MKRLYISLLLMLPLASLQLHAQDKTMNLDRKPQSTREALDKHKAMLIPFEKRMYLSEIDHLINRETKLSAQQIRTTFREGLDEQLYKKLKAKMGVLSLLDDTVKTKKDLASIYQYLSYDYQKVPNQANYQAPKNEKNQKQIDKGQLAVETNNDARFMNARVKNATLVPYLTGKYKTDLFIFINQLEIKAGEATASTDMALNNSPRRIVVHYTVYTDDAREINSGIAETSFPYNLNNPTKIVNTYFSIIADIIAARIEKALAPKP